MNRIVHPAAVPVAAFLSVVAPSPARAQDALTARLQEIRQRGEAGDHARAIAIADSLFAAHPDHPNIVFNRARAFARAGRAKEAADVVRRLLRWDARYARRALADSALAPIRAQIDAELRDVDVAALAARADQPIARAQVWTVLEERDLVPEGTAWDPATRSVLVGSLNKRKIVAIAPDGSVRDRVPRASNGLASVVGIHVDSARGVLWAASNPRYDQPTDTTPSALFAFDAATGRFRSRHVLRTGRRHFLNDITTGRDGAVYVTDSRDGGVWVLRPGARDLERFAPAAGFASPNGITISADGRHLFVAADDGIRVVPLAGGATWRLTVPDSFTVAGIDGLAFDDDALIAHHPLAFWRIARYPLDAAHRAIAGREIIEANTADSRTSTTGEVAGGWYVFIGNSQIDRMNAGTLDSARMDPIRMYRVPLRPAPNDAATGAAVAAPGAAGVRGRNAAPRGMVTVALSARDSVALFDAESLERVGTVAVGRNPHEIAPSRDGRRAFVANGRDTSISVIDIGAGSPAAGTWILPDTIRVHDVGVSADGRTVWAASGARSLVLELDATSGRVRRRFPIERSGSWMLETGGPGGSIVVANLEGGAVTLLDPATGRQRVLPGAEGQIDAAATPDGREIWSVNFRDGHLTVFDARSGRRILREPSGAGAGRVLFTPDGRTALVVSGGDSTVTAIDARSKRRGAAVGVAGDPKVIAISSDGRRAYVSHPGRDTLTMIDVASMTVLRSVPAAGTPDGVAVLEPRRR